MTAGGRTDWTPSACDTVTFQGDVYAGHSGTTSFGFQPEDNPVQGHNVLTRWSRVLDESTDWSLQAYYDISDRSTSLSQHVEIFDVDYQYRFSLGCRNNLLSWEGPGCLVRLPACEARS